jgi:hypothetical protein
MAVAMDRNAFVVKDAYCLINIMVWGMRAECRRGNLLENLYLEDQQVMEG